MDHVLYDAGAFRIGRFRRKPSDRPFADTGPIVAGHLLVFPRTSVLIRHAGRAPVVADPTRVMLYNLGQEYTRGVISDRGDACEWFAFPVSAIQDAMRGRDPAVDERGDKPFDAVWAPARAHTYLLQRRIVEHLSRSPEADALLVEESMMAILADVTRMEPPREVGRGSRVHRALADACREVVAKRLGERWSLSAIASTVGVSPFHLARVFRRDAGMTLHAYLHQLRLRAALERVADGEDLARVAVDLGYASHSHFTSLFRSAFRVTPSEFRRRARARS